MKESKVGLDLSGVPHVLQGLGGGVVLLEHEVGRGDGGGSAVATVAGNEHLTTSHLESSVNELGTILQVLSNVLSWHILIITTPVKATLSSHQANSPCK